MRSEIHKFTEVVRNLLHGTPTTQSAGERLYPLTERLSFLLKYVDAVSVDDALTIANTPGYSILAPYFGLKLLDQHPDLQKKMLTSIVDTFANSGANNEIVTSLKQILKPNGIAIPDSDLNPVSAVELSRVATWGPQTIDDRAQEALLAVREHGDVPVIIGYGGLLALKVAITTMEIGQHIMVILPKKIGTNQFGYSIKKTEKGMNIETLTPTDLDTDQSISLIDDATHSGNTFTNVGAMFPKAAIANIPLFRT